MKEEDTNLLIDTLLQFKDMYHKLLIINLTTDNYIPVVARHEQLYIDKDTTMKISAYWDWFTNSDLVHEDDRAKLKALNLEASINTFTCYRRVLDDGQWHWVVMKIMPSEKFSKDNKECILYVLDINAIYNREYERVVELLDTIDPLTGLYNKTAYERDTSRFKTGLIGVLFADINGLKYTNDKYGHAAGDGLIQDFASILKNTFKDRFKCYHISGDEFIVIGYNIKIHKFLQDMNSFHKSFWDNGATPIASIGYSAGESDDIVEIQASAEKFMYEDKLRFYNKFPEKARK